MVAGSPESGFMQSWDWSVFKEIEGYDVLRFGIFEGDTLCGGAIAYAFAAPIEAGMLALPDGPVLPWKAEKAPGYFRSLITALKKSPMGRQAVTVRIEPRLREMPSFLGSLVRAPIDLVPNETLEIRLGPEDGMLEQMKPKGRYNARLAERLGVKVKSSADTGDVHEFYFVLQQTARYQNFNVEPKSFFINLARCLFPQRARFAFARYRGMTLAAALSVRFGDTVTYLYGGHVPLFRSAMASYALHWHLLREAAQEGYRLYDFYGYASPDRPEHPYAGFSRFKEKFGGATVKRIGSYDLVLYDRLAGAALRILQTTG